MALSQRVFSDALRDMQRAMAVFQQPFYFGDDTGLIPLSSSGTSFFNDFQGIRYPTTDMSETPEAYEIHAELPGYDKKDIKVELSDDHHTLVLSGSVNKETETKPAELVSEEKKDKEEKSKEKGKKSKDSKSKAAEGQLTTTSKKDKEGQLVKADSDSNHKWLVKERVSGSFTRSFSLSSPVDASGITASYNDGVLKVVVPKSVKRQRKQINIE